MQVVGRKAGKKFFPVTITLSQAQIDYLRTKPNASGLIRQILDNLIASESHVEQKLGAVSMNFQLEQLYKKLSTLKDERWHYLFSNMEQKWQTVKGNTVWEEFSIVPKQLDTEQGKIAWRVLQGYDDAIKVLEAQIAELKQKIIG